MVLRHAYVPELPEMEPFLFASVGEEVNGIPLSVLSALARLGLDPREEATRLSHLTSKMAASQLAGMFARLPDRPWTSSEIRRIASKLVELLPVPKGGDNGQIASATYRTPNPMASRHLIHLALVLSGALVFGLIAHGYATSDGNETTPPVSQTDSVTPSDPLMR
jgi:hypothetical protein